MTDRIVRLGEEDLWEALEGLDPVEVFCEGRQRPCPMTRAGHTADDGHALFQHAAGGGLLLACADLRALSVSLLSTLAAQLLLPPGIITGGLHGGDQAQRQLSLLARHIPGLTHVALIGADEGLQPVVEPRVRDQLDLAGIGMSVVPDLPAAVLGADLVIASGSGSRELEFDRLAKGSLLIHTAGDPLPPEVAARADQVFVDDVSLLPHEPAGGPRFVTADGAPAVGTPSSDGCRHVDADLAQVLFGLHPGRAGFGDIVLVELLGAARMDLAVAGRLRQSALELGLGTEMN